MSSPRVIDLATGGAPNSAHAESAHDRDRRTQEETGEMGEPPPTRPVGGLKEGARGYLWWGAFQVFSAEDNAFDDAVIAAVAAASRAVTRFRRAFSARWV